MPRGSVRLHQSCRSCWRCSRSWIGFSISWRAGCDERLLETGWDILAGCVVSWSVQGEVRATLNDFQRGTAAYEQKDFELAAQLFAASITNEMSAGAWQNLGNSQWQLGWTAEALIAWERARALDPFAAEPNNLKFVRDTAQLRAGIDVVRDRGGLVAGGVVGVVGVREFLVCDGAAAFAGGAAWRRAAGQQALVALGLGVFLLTVPANYGVWTRTRIGLVLAPETSLRYTPTAEEGEPVTRLSAGEPARVVRKRGNYMLIQTRRGEGWVEQRQLGLLFPR